MNHGPSDNPELDEATALALCIVINNQIEVLRAFERKLRAPYLPQYGRIVTLHRKPTLATAMQVLVCGQQLRLGTLRALAPWLKGKVDDQRARE